MRLVQGQTLLDLIEKGRWNLTRAVNIIDQVAAAGGCGDAEVDPSRYQAAEHPCHPGRFRVPGRLRHAEASGDAPADDGGKSDRHVELYGARTI